MPKPTHFTLQVTLNKARRGDDAPLGGVLAAWHRAVPLPPPLMYFTVTGRSERRSQRDPRGQLSLQSRSAETSLAGVFQCQHIVHPKLLVATSYIALPRPLLLIGLFFPTQWSSRILAQVINALPGFSTAALLFCFLFLASPAIACPLSYLWANEKPKDLPAQHGSNP
ncbi:hypothetical protein HBH56_070790 [Parastagonospora nodorum]|jgi:hypothetical protein|nr:hypothetical protein HBH56_070790 [Parastagonospora nodorum]KAH3955196.1 hypothetical protein HBH53_017040 [Parastagonospora nodorum]KAH3986036.1 hypothetical protein HBH52_048190 [Parastagonospora nodorum]KAH4040639.1 hypothetical protein HBI09_030540 [Parastagonospora nodorum]KAH4109816.1 hypothetical protein HBH46_031190 [Parastagonospora nodorum]